MHINQLFPPDYIHEFLKQRTKQAEKAKATSYLKKMSSHFKKHSKCQNLSISIRKFIDLDHFVFSAIIFLILCTIMSLCTHTTYTRVLLFLLVIPAWYYVYYYQSNCHHIAFWRIFSRGFSRDALVMHMLTSICFPWVNGSRVRRSGGKKLRSRHGGALLQLSLIQYIIRSILILPF